IFGYAALQAYAAYGNDSFLKFAEANWERLRPAMLTDADITARSVPFKNFTLASTCPNSTTLAGGVLHDIVSLLPSSNYLDPHSALEQPKYCRYSGKFHQCTYVQRIDGLIQRIPLKKILTIVSRLSASLTAATSNQTYLDYARKSIDFLQQHLYRGNATFTGADARNCSVDPTTKPNPYETGSVIHALSLVASLDKNATVMSFIHDIVIATTTYAPWHDGSGILSTGDNGEGRAHMMRGYTELYQGNNTPIDLKTYLGTYLATQYNAVTNISKLAGSDIYGLEWDTKPSDIGFSAQSQTAAISVLVSGMTLSQSGDSGTPTPEPTSSINPSASVPKGAVAGGVVGGIAGIGLIILAIWLYKRGKHDWIKESRRPPDAEHIVNPFPLAESRLNEAREKPGPAHARDSTEISATRQRDSKLSEKRDASRTTAGDHTNTGGGVGPSSSQSVDDTIENLLAALNRRLRDERRQVDNRQWDPEESPPRYPEGEQG
ncbi:hypothetical protein V5O48_017030, partial [Marasmius crinis-equi]